MLAPITLYVYSMWVSRVECSPTDKNRQVVIPFNPFYKLASGYGQLVTVMERVPKIDGYTMPPPRMGGAGAVADMELNAMFKSVLHRPTTLVHTTDSLTQDPLEPYKVYHLQPSKEDPSHPWSPNCAFSGAWYAYFDSVHKARPKRLEELMRTTRAGYNMGDTGNA